MALYKSVNKVTLECCFFMDLCFFFLYIRLFDLGTPLVWGVCACVMSLGGSFVRSK